MINFKAVALRRGQRLLFENASFTIHKGEKVGITGANGAGKSSLFGLLLDTLHPETGEFSMPPGLEIAHVAQETPASASTALDYVMDGDRELRQIEAELRQAEAANDGVALAHAHGRFEAVGGYDAPARAAKLLNGLGFAPGDERRAVSEFSGGWRMRLNVAQALMCRSDVLLLDEPTNHLDLDAVIWLQDWLSVYPGTLLLISHDRDFLDDLTDHILHIEHQGLTLYTGNYSAFETRRAEILAQQQASYDRQQREIAHVRSFVDRFRAQATKARQVQSRLKALSRMELIAQAQVDSPFEFAFLPPEKLPSPLLKLDDAAGGYGDKTIFSGAKLTVNPGDRIGLLGPNGAGKSTLVKLLAGELPLLAGQRLAAQDLRIGYFAQHQLEQLRPEHSALWHLQKLDPKATEKDLRNFLGGFGFRGDQALDPIAPFSGGEKSRLALALLIYQRPNLLLLDEPTNHLDLNARDALSLALQDYQGALIVVSHDRYLLRTVADDFWLVADGVMDVFSGDLDDYRLWLSARRNARDSDSAKPAAPSRKDQRKSDADRRKALRPLRLALEKAEAAMEKFAAQKQALETRLADPELYLAEAKARLQAVLLEKAGVEKSLEEAEGAWLEAGEALEAAEAEGMES
ncbi:ATP-binding cassette, subfamily F, member 3 [Methylomagnum ishizawai]|uniref:Probable ATP-binding protein YheS n=1 Tax=Methylomagnum ishizawai TaxID=1760988 RepID=A0A1Y6D6L8_9GAMM|nr:ATP-binding cassette domain-containing protein [Methylomagnum ishizawai]SMF96004.1 ATP-binding cassette, subfamily F, member 3 [Methylomagnum ishizawai]